METQYVMDAKTHSRFIQLMRQGPVEISMRLTDKNRYYRLTLTRFGHSETSCETRTARTICGAVNAFFDKDVKDEITNQEL